ncbi:MAG: hypothetical protein Q9213_004790 [Squamulea squamosa]
MQPTVTRRVPTTVRLKQWHLYHKKRLASGAPSPWRPAAILDEWVQREARPISLRQLTFFGRTLTENRLLSSANYVRTELPTRLAHRLRDMQTLPYVVVTNPHMSHVYELYYKAFETLRKVREIKTVDDNDRYCKIITETLQEHLTVIPKLAMGIIECQSLMKPQETDKFMNTLLRSRISRRVIAEQHLALTETFHAPWHFPDAKLYQDPSAEFIGDVFLKCNAKEVIEECSQRAKSLAREAFGSARVLPEVNLEGHLNATFPYILSHLQYIIGELLRNSIEAVVERCGHLPGNPAPIEVLICEAPHHVIIRISDQGGGIPKDILPNLWSFGKGPRSHIHLENLERVPRMAATMQELKLSTTSTNGTAQDANDGRRPVDGSLSSLTYRPPNLRLGMGLPMSRVYAEYWAGNLELHSLEGYGVDAFLTISKLGNKNEQLSTRASMDAI